MIVAGAEVAVGAIALALAADHHRDLGVGLPVDEAVDHLDPGTLELARPEQVLLLVEAGLELDHRGDRLAGLGRGDQRGDDGRLLAGAVECLLDRHHLGIGGGLAQEVDHHLEALVGVVDHDVLLADRREAIAVVFEDPLGIARRIGLELEIGARLLDDRGEAREIDRAAHPQHQRGLEPELAAQQRLGGGIEAVLHLEQDHPAAPPPLDRGAEVAHQILGILLDLDVAVAQHAERPVAVDAEAREQHRGMAADQLDDRDPDRAVAAPARGDLGREPHEARQGRRDQHHLGHRRAIGDPGEREHDAHALVGDERERVGRIDRLGGDDRQDVRGEVAGDPLRLGAIELLVLGDHADALGGEEFAELLEAGLLRRDEFDHAFADRGKLEHRGAPVERDLLDPALRLAGEPGDPHHHELVEVAARDRKETQPLEQRVVWVLRLGEHAAVELEPAQLAVEVELGARHPGSVERLAGRTTIGGEQGLFALFHPQSPALHPVMVPRRLRKRCYSPVTTRKVPPARRSAPAGGR